MRQCLAVLASVVTLIACGGSGPSLTPIQTVTGVHITRTPGLLVLPPIDKTITDRTVAGQLADDIHSLPAFPKGPVFCPIDFGTTYDLVFSTLSAGAPWSAVVSVLGCRTVKLNDGQTLWAINSPKLFTDLGSALGLAPDELVPRPCPAETAGSRCYPQPSPPNG